MLHLNTDVGNKDNLLAMVGAALPEKFSVVAEGQIHGQPVAVATTAGPVSPLQLYVAGLSCAGCIPAIVGALTPLSHISHVTVSLHNQPGRVSTLSLHLDDAAGADDVVAAVRSALPKQFSIVSAPGDAAVEDVITPDAPRVRRFRCGCGNNACKCSAEPVEPGDAGVLVRFSSTDSSYSTSSMSCCCTNERGGACVCGKKAATQDDVLYSISGMTCAACVSKVRDVLRALPGVKSASVSLLTARAVLEVDPGRFDPEKAVERLKPLGYKITDVTQDAVQRDEVFLRFSSLDKARKAVEILNDSSLVAKAYLFNRNTAKYAGDEEVHEKSFLRRSQRKKKQLPIIKFSSYRKLDAVKLLDQGREEGDGLAYKVISRNDPILTGNLEATAMLQKEAHRLRFLFIGAFICTLPVALCTMLFSRVDALGANGLQHLVGGSGFRVVDIIAFVLATPVQFLFGFRFYRGSWYSLKQRRANMDLLIALGTSIAYFFSVTLLVLNTIQIRRGLEVTEDAMAFETSSLLITIVLFGKWMETVAKKKTTAGVESLTKLAPRLVTLVSRPPSSQPIYSEPVNAELVSVGDHFQVNPGSSFPLDGAVQAGETTVDESMLTGESWPVRKVPGDGVYAGTVNGSGAVVVRCTASDSDSMLEKIIALVKRAQDSRAPIEAVADKVSAIFVPVVLIIALTVTVIWFALIQSAAIPRDWADGEGNVLFALLFGLSVLVISCPCAFGLATPTVVMMATSIGAQKLGILYKDGGEALEAAHRVQTVLFDKTGTLTVGKPVVTRASSLAPSADDETILSRSGDTAPDDTLLHIIGAAESLSDHPLAQAIASYTAAHTAQSMRLKESLKESSTLSSHQAVAGKGVKCVLDDGDGEVREVRIGEAAWALSSTDYTLSHGVQQTLNGWEDSGKTVVLACVPRQGVVAFGIEDAVRPDSAAVIAHLHGRGVRCGMVTGDSAGTARAVARQVGIADEDVHARALPGDKVRVVYSHGRGGRGADRDADVGADADADVEVGRGGDGVAFVGDGINDAGALAAACVGVAMGSGSQMAAEKAGIVVMRDGVWGVAVALDLARCAFRRIQINYLWALGFNTLAIPLAGGALFPVIERRIPPFVAAAAMGLSSLAVVGSSLALRLYKPPVFEARDRLTEVVDA